MEITFPHHTAFQRVIMKIYGFKKNNNQLQSIIQKKHHLKAVAAKPGNRSGSNLKAEHEMLKILTFCYINLFLNQIL